MVNKEIWIDKFDDLEVVKFPFRMENVIIIVIFSLVFSWIFGFASSMGLIAVVRSLMLIYIFGLFFVAYLFVILDYTAQGYQKPPKLSGNLFESGKGSFFSLIIIVSLFFSLYFLSANVIWRLAMSCFSLIFLPVSICVLAVQGSLATALNPVMWLGVIRGINVDAKFIQYMVILVVTVLTCQTAFFLDLGWFNILTMAIFVTTVMMLFRSLGVVLHSNADNLGMSVRYSHQVEAQQTEKSVAQELSAFSRELYKLSSADRSKQAWQLLEQRLIKDDYESEAQIYSRIRDFPNPTLAIKAGQGYIERLIAAKDHRTAWYVLEFCFKANHDEFTFLKGNSLINLAQRAETRDQKRMIVSILRYFEDDFPKNPNAGEALLLAARYLANDLNDFDQAGQLVEKIYRDYPKMQTHKKLQALSAILKQL